MANSSPSIAKMLPDGSASYSRIPLVDLPATLLLGTEPASSPVEPKPLSAKPSRDRDKEVKTPEQEEDDHNRRRLPL